MAWSPWGNGLAFKPLNPSPGRPEHPREQPAGCNCTVPPGGTGTPQTHAFPWPVQVALGRLRFVGERQLRHLSQNGYGHPYSLLKKKKKNTRESVRRKITSHQKAIGNSKRKAL